MQTELLTVEQLPASTGTRYTSDLYDIFSVGGSGLGVGTADEINGFVRDGVFAAEDIRMKLIWQAGVGEVK